jgi:hypothetical protein
MAEQTAKPLSEFKVTKALNGGWVVMPFDGDMGRRLDVHAFSTAADMLAALPGLIGAPVSQVDLNKTAGWVSDGEQMRYTNEVEIFGGHPFTDEQRTAALNAMKTHRLVPREV